MKCPIMRIDDEHGAIYNGSILEGTRWCDGIHHYKAFAPKIYNY